MYGIILDSLTDYIRRFYGEETWKRVVGSTDISNTMFTTHKIYDEQLIPMIAKATGEITGNDINTIMEQAGKHFIAYIDDIRNDQIAKVLGRTFKDFLNGLDSMHEYYRFSFPELQPPSFFVAAEDSRGLELHYRSRRTFTGFMFYVKGILYEIASSFYSMSVQVGIVHHGITGDVLCAVFRLDFCNDEYTRYQDLIMAKRVSREKNNLAFPSHLFFELFPFHVVFDHRLAILSTGHGLNEIYPGLSGKRINETFFLIRPLGYDLTWENILIHTNNVFELASVKAAGRRGKTDDTSRFRHQMVATHFIKLRGQMLYVEEWNCVIFLSTLMLDDLNTMYEMGIYVNDLTFHDLSRDMVLRGPQQTTEYKLALNLEQGKTARLEEIIETLDSERRKTDDLLYSMIPKEIARSLRLGNTTVSLCEKYDDVTILFSDIVNFACIYMHIAPHEIMIILNMMVSVFDILCKKFEIYKVETVADGFMAVSGAPTYDEHHARNMADMALEMLNGIKTVKDPNTTASIHIRIGLHCGYVIAGLVGHKIPRYCLFGDTVNIASKMEATGEGQRIQISQTCKENLENYAGRYIVEDKGAVHIKGCGHIMTYWLKGADPKTEILSGEEVIVKGIRNHSRPNNGSSTAIEWNESKIETDDKIADNLTANKKKGSPVSISKSKSESNGNIKSPHKETKPIEKKKTNSDFINQHTPKEFSLPREPESTKMVSMKPAETKINRKKLKQPTTKTEKSKPGKKELTVEKEEPKPEKREPAPKQKSETRSPEVAYRNLLKVIKTFDGKNNGDGKITGDEIPKLGKKVSSLETRILGSLDNESTDIGNNKMIGIVQSLADSPIHSDKVQTSSPLPATPRIVVRGLSPQKSHASPDFPLKLLSNHDSGQQQKIQALPIKSANTSYARSTQLSIPSKSPLPLLRTGVGPGMHGRDQQKLFPSPGWQTPVHASDDVASCPFEAAFRKDDGGRSGENVRERLLQSGLGRRSNQLKSKVCTIL